MQPTIPCLACLKHLQMCRNAYVRKRVTTWLLVLSLSLSRSLFLTYSVFLTKELCDLTSVLEIFWLSMLLLLRHWSAFLSWEPTLSFSRPLFLTHNMFLTNILCDDVGVRNILAKHGTVATSLELIFMMGTYRFTVVLRGESLQNVNTQYLCWQSWTRTQLFSQHKLHTGTCHVQNDLLHLPHLTTAARGGSCVRRCKKKKKKHNFLFQQIFWYSMYRPLRSCIEHERIAFEGASVLSSGGHSLEASWSQPCTASSAGQLPFLLDAFAAPCPVLSMSCQLLHFSSPKNYVLLNVAGMIELNDN